LSAAAVAQESDIMLARLRGLHLTESAGSVAQALEVKLSYLGLEETKGREVAPAGATLSRPVSN
jgi:hypothetical protein